MLPRRQRRPDAQVAQAADAYADADPGTRIAAVAERCCCSESNASNLIRDAKDRGFLVNRKLTDRARAVEVEAD